MQPGKTILKIGFDTDNSLLALAEAVGSAGEVYEIDLSQIMLEIVSDKVARAGLELRVDLRCGDDVKLPFYANDFNAIFMSFILELFDTPEIP